ncbi:MAG: alanine--tRNA ligase [Nitrososphaerota archaeon]
MRFSPEAYRLEFFLYNGFVRKKCPVCGEYFWTLDANRDVCGESPCVPYTFIGKRLTKERLTLRDAREKFLRFFERKGHKIVKPYPVVPRWRTDLYLVSASIVDFQPWVTSGIAPPPANPLVVSQPCIRLVDIDKVGLTFGRHLTIFEMGGAHAFNYPDKEVYWKDTTVEYHHEFATKELGIKPESITYKESAWYGGGNAGPCFETISEGLELATLVFMHYKTIDNELVEIPIKTVDTGYGIERYAWFSQGTHSSFKVIYGELYKKIMNMLGVEEPDENILDAYSPYTAIVTPKEGTSIAEVRRKISKLSGIPIETIEKLIVPLERFFASLDYTKSISFILSEGIVPSNVKSGYLARLLIRKAYRVLQAIGHKDKLLDLINMQIEYWSADFPHLSEMRDEVLDIVMTEVSKFEETIEKGTAYVERELASLKKRSDVVPLEFLVKVYDERGITPEIVENVSQKLKLKVEVPENFYEYVASRHLQEAPTVVGIEKGLETITQGLSPTIKLFYDFPFEARFEAKVLRVSGDYVILDRTLFYAESGGQVGDTGILRFSTGECKVVDTQLVNGVIVHKVSGAKLAEGEHVVGEVDIERRLKIMRHHTATHILLSAARQVLGKHVWQAGAKKEPDKARLDISHHKRLTADEVERIESLANEIVQKRIPINVRMMDRNEAERLYGFRLYQGGEVPSAVIRVVEIPNWDAQACGGLHCTNTEDVGLIKIIKTERIQDGVERLIFAAGPSALPYIQEQERTVRKVAEVLGVPASDLHKKVEELLTELRNVRKTAKKTMELYAKKRAVELVSNAEVVNGISVIKSYEEIDDVDYLISLAVEALNKISGPAVAILLAGTESIRVLTMVNEVAIKVGINAGQIASRVSSALGGRGGGRPDMGQGGAPYSERVHELLKTVEKIIQE